MVQGYRSPARKVKRMRKLYLLAVDSGLEEELLLELRRR